MSNADPILDARDLSVWRGERCLFRALAFRVAAGELVWVRGPNGVGKTTLLRVVAGLGLADAGGCTLHDDATLMYLGHLDALKRELTPRENLRAWCALHEVVADSTAIDAAFGQLGIAAVADLPVAQLSAGQRRRAALARLSLSRAALWLLDEPTTHLDEQGQRVVATLIDAQLARGGAVVTASHLALGVRGRVTELALGAAA